MRKYLLLICLMFFYWEGLVAQYDMRSIVPLNPAIRTGKLSNGLTYYICRNTQPSGCASFYIIQDVGAILENDDQKGLAHFLEHMAFNGTKNFPDRRIYDCLSPYGVKMGNNINASTGHNETIYMLTDIPVAEKQLVDTCLLILHDWLHYITFGEDKIDKERKVIIEEERTTQDVRARLKEKTLPVLFKDSKYAGCNVVGDMNIIKNFKRQALIDFYQDWHRPDLQAVAVVGDIDPDEVELKIKQLFSTIPAAQNPRKREFITIPFHDEPYYSLATDREMPYSSVSINMMFKDAAPEEKDHAYMKNLLVEMAYNMIMKNRIEALLQEKNPPFAAASSNVTSLMRGYKGYVIAATANMNGEARAFEAIYAENERVLRYGFMESEVELIKDLLLKGFRAVYAASDRVSNSQLLSEIQAHFLTNEPAPGLEYYYQFAEEIIPQITVEEVSQKAKDWINGENMVISILGTKGVQHITKGEVMAVINKVKKMQLKPNLKENTPQLPKVLILEDITPGKIVEEKQLEKFDAYQWKLQNGATVIFRKADYEKDQVVLNSYSPGGMSVYEADMLPSAMMLNRFMPAYGIGDHDAFTFSKMLTGKSVRCRAEVGSLSESVSGYSSPEEFETLMQWVWLSFRKPRFDPQAHEIMMQQAFTTLKSDAMGDSLQLIMNNYSARTQLYNEEFLKRVSLDKIEKIYRERISDASDFTFFIVGNINIETVRPLVEKYIGSIPSLQRKDCWKDHGVRRPQGRVNKQIKLCDNTPHKATVIALYSKEMPYSISDNIKLGIFQSILQFRATYYIREKAGGSYNIGVETNSSRTPYPEYNLSCTFDCEPGRTEELKNILFEQMEALIKEGPSQEELIQVVISLRNQYEQSKLHNAYWGNALYTYVVEGIDITDPTSFSGVIDRMTPEDIRSFAERFLTDADLIDLTFLQD